jgi:hypothetical protein
MEEFSNPTSPKMKWTKRIGLVAFLFFLIKGLMWLVIPSIIAYLALDR